MNCARCGRPIGPAETAKICSVVGGDTCKLVENYNVALCLTWWLLALLESEQGHRDPADTIEVRTARAIVKERFPPPKESAPTPGISPSGAGSRKSGV